MDWERLRAQARLLIGLAELHVYELRLESPVRLDDYGYENHYAFIAGGYCGLESHWRSLFADVWRSRTLEELRSAWGHWSRYGLDKIPSGLIKGGLMESHAAKIALIEEVYRYKQFLLGVDSQTIEAMWTKEALERSF